VFISFNFGEIMALIYFKINTDFFKKCRNIFRKIIGNDEWGLDLNLDLGVGLSLRQKKLP